MSEFTLRAIVAQPYERVVERVRALLAEAGFGVLTEIDLAATLETKLGVSVPPQLILGACRPQLAHRAVQADPRVATLLPCNAVVAAEGPTRTRVEVLDPATMASFGQDAELAEIAADARARLLGMLDRLSGDEEVIHAVGA